MNDLSLTTPAASESIFCFDAYEAPISFLLKFDRRRRFSFFL
jgi:hypothetical protein